MASATMDVCLLTPRFFEASNIPLTTIFSDTRWSPTPSETQRYVPLAFGAGYNSNAWNGGLDKDNYLASPTSMLLPYIRRLALPPIIPCNGESHWTSPAPVSPKMEDPLPPSIVCVPGAGQLDDDVSVLNDDPDEDDAQLLPHSTYDVLVPLLHEMYKDESEMEEEVVVNAVVVAPNAWDRRANILGDGAQAA